MLYMPIFYLRFHFVPDFFTIGYRTSFRLKVHWDINEFLQARFFIKNCVLCFEAGYFLSCAYAEKMYVRS